MNWFLDTYNKIKEFFFGKEDSEELNDTIKTEENHSLKDKIKENQEEITKEKHSEEEDLEESEEEKNEEEDLEESEKEDLEDKDVITNLNQFDKINSDKELNSEFNNNEGNLNYYQDNYNNIDFNDHINFNNPINSKEINFFTID